MRGEEAGKGKTESKREKFGKGLNDGCPCEGKGRGRTRVVMQGRSDHSLRVVGGAAGHQRTRRGWRGNF